MRLIRNVMVVLMAGISPAIAGKLEPLVPLEEKFVELTSVDTAYPCTHRFSGLIEKGDSQLFARLEIPQGNFAQICLDSPGGSFVEAIAIARILSERLMGTRIDAGQRCESACALVFMAGSFNSFESGNYRWRVLDPHGRLGFHAPALQVEGGDYDAASVTRAYDLAMATVARSIFDLILRKEFQDGAMMKVSLLGHMLNTPAASMFYVQTVDQAARWDIDVGPVALSGRADARTLTQGCENAWRWLHDEAGVRIDSAYPVSMQQDNGFNRPSVIIDEMSGDSCTFGVERENAALTELTRIDTTGRGTMDLAPWGFLDPSTRLADLPRGPAKTGNIRPVLTVPDVSATTLAGANGQCTVGEPPSFFDDEPCIREERTEGSGKRLKAITTYTWPSGAKTVVVADRRGTTINGGSTRLEPNPRGQGECAMNPKTGNRFCYLSR
ncbi:MAG: hypothetical protein KDJ73_13380 [Notoacmeibacter sp.]|nr:hypothetical protein [Notoacmeibacter sp.]MCC0033335.1 hypothetical protein [Brucellaceae bacterium]